MDTVANDDEFNQGHWIRLAGLVNNKDCSYAKLSIECLTECKTASIHRKLKKNSTLKAF